MRSPLALGLALVVPLALAACDPMTAAIVGVNAATFAMTDKTPADHVASWVTGLDCSLRQAADTRQYCRDPETKVAAAPLYCYRTIGKISCYNEPDPHASDSQLVQ